MEQWFSFYTSSGAYNRALAAALGLVLFTVIGTLFVKTPYGRFGEGTPGVRLSPRLGWFLMEFPATVSFMIFYWSGRNALEPVPLVLFAVWCVHYANRGFIFPFRMRVAPDHRQSFNFSVVAIGWIVTSLHGYLNGSYFSEYGSQYVTSWLYDPRFIAGILIYYGGFILTVRSESIMRDLRSRDPKPDEPRYRIPRGGMFRFVTNPQYLGELAAWAGFALFTWSPGGIFIFLISAANLVPRALENHRWYREQFPDYPPERKALVPYIL